jgi:tetratricopeptide (TPR) repeat protein
VTLAAVGLLCLPVVAQSAPDPATSSFDQLVASGASARDAGDLKRAIELYRQAVAIRPTWPDGWWYLGSLQYGVSDYPAARDALTHFIGLTPTAGPATALRGLCEYETGEYAQALKDIEDGLGHGAATQARNERILRGHEALLLTREGRFEDALRTYAFFARDGAPKPEMAVGIGLAGLRTPLLPRDVSGDKGPLFLETGNALFQFMAGNAAAAKRGFEALFERYPATPNLHYVYGYQLFATDPEQAIAEFKRELEVNPKSAPAEAFLAWASIMREDPAGALPSATKAVADDPTLPLAQLVLGRAMVDTGNLHDGTLHLERASQLDPGNLENHLALAHAYSESGRKEDAYRERMASLAISRNEPIAHP